MTTVNTSAVSVPRITVIDPHIPERAKLRVAAYARVSSDTDDQINSYIAQTRFGVNGQPNYLILGRDGQELVPKRAYNLDVEAYIDFLKSGVEAYNKTK